MPLLRLFFFHKKRAIHIRIVKNINRRQPLGFEAHDTAAVGEFFFVSNIKIAAQETINGPAGGIFLILHSISNPFTGHSPFRSLSLIINANAQFVQDVLLLLLRQLNI